MPPLLLAPCHGGARACVRERHRTDSGAEIPPSHINCHSLFSSASFLWGGREPTTERLRPGGNTTDKPVNEATAAEPAEAPPRGEESWAKVLEAEPRCVCLEWDLFFFLSRGEGVTPSLSRRLFIYFLNPPTVFARCSGLAPIVRKSVWRS